MNKLRELARGEMCMVRVPGICNANPETTVLAHVRMIGLSGMGMKSPDWFGAWACSACHDYVDGRHSHRSSAVQRRLDLLEGMVRTQHELLKRGYLPEAQRVTGE
jgi:hypothetical protein